MTERELHSLLKTEHSETREWLFLRFLESGGDPDVRDVTGYRFLYKLIYWEDLASFQLLLSWGASVHALCEDKESPVESIMNHYLDPWRPLFLSELLARGADPNYCTPGRTAPLLRACQGAGMFFKPFYQAGLDVFRLLLAYGADPNVQDGQGLTPLSWAQLKGCAQRVNYLRAYSVSLSRSDL